MLNNSEQERQQEQPYSIRRRIGKTNKYEYLSSNTKWSNNKHAYSHYPNNDFDTIRDGEIIDKSNNILEQKGNPFVFSNRRNTPTSGYITIECDSAKLSILQRHELDISSYVPMTTQKQTIQVFVLKGEVSLLKEMLKA